MEAQIVHTEDIRVVRFKGFLNFEVADVFRKNCLKELSGEKVVFNLKDLSFVGSSGITLFVEVLANFYKMNSVRPRFCHLASEFRRLFLSSEINDFEIFDDEISALRSFVLTCPPPEPVPTPSPLVSSESSDFGSISSTLDQLQKYEVFE